MQLRTLVSGFTGSIVLLWMSGLLLAQSGSGNLAGTVYDQAGARLDHAAIIVKNANTGAETSTHPTDRGEYRLDNIPAGKYSVRVHANGLATVQINDVFIQPNKTANINVTLPVAQSTPISVVEVSEAPEPLDNTPPAAAPHPPPPTAPETLDHAKAALREVTGLRDRLALSADQQTQIRAIFQDRQAQIANIRADTSLPLSVRREKIKATRADAESKLRALLNENQRDEYEEILRERAERSLQKQETTLASSPR